MPDDAALDLEAVLLEDPGEVPRGLDFLEAQLAEAEHRVHHLLRHLGQAVHVLGHAALERHQRGVVGTTGRRCRGRLGDRGLRQRRRGAQGRRRQRQSKGHGPGHRAPPERGRAPSAPVSSSAQCEDSNPRYAWRGADEVDAGGGRGGGVLRGHGGGADGPAIGGANGARGQCPEARPAGPRRLEQPAGVAPRRCSRGADGPQFLGRAADDRARRRRSNRCGWSAKPGSSAIPATACGSRRWCPTPMAGGTASITTNGRPTTASGPTASCHASAWRAPPIRVPPGRISASSSTPRPTARRAAPRTASSSAAWAMSRPCWITTRGTCTSTSVSTAASQRSRG